MADPTDHEQYLARAVFSPKHAADVFAKIAPLLSNSVYAKAFYEHLAEHGIKGFDIPSSASTKENK
jgi:hypothetical protein